MTKCLVTGAAGFVGSHLCEALLAKGHEVVAVDAFLPYYPRSLKEENLVKLRENKRFSFYEKDLRSDDLVSVVDGCEVVFHLAAMAGLMLSWRDLELYSSCNLVGTQRLLEVGRTAGIKHFIHVSTSSVYGREAVGGEGSELRPFSPYGITKLAAENLCWAYEANFGMPVTILRYFSVYGPRQRPDMAYNILIRSVLAGQPFLMYGDGEQTRSNTFVGDCVAGTILAFEKRSAAVGRVFNIGGGEVVSLNRVISLVEELLGKKAVLERQPPRPGDQKHTAANIELARRYLGYDPATGVRGGLEAQIAWQKERRYEKT